MDHANVKAPGLETSKCICRDDETERDPVEELGKYCYLFLVRLRDECSNDPRQSLVAPKRVLGSFYTV